MVSSAAAPMTHISSLVTNMHNVCIQMMDPWDVFYAVDRSTDLPKGKTMDEHFGELLDRKYENCTEWYRTNLATLGIQEPLVIIVRSDTREWQMDEGHHRLSWALRHHDPGEIEIPFVFDDTGADDESHMGFLVSRANVAAYHNTMTEELLVVSAGQELVEQTDEFLALAAEKVKGDIVFIPTPRRTAKHRNGGRHRAS